MTEGNPVSSQENKPETDPKPVLSSTLAGKPSVKQQSWGVFIAIILIVLMIILGALYSWGHRVAEEHSYGVPSSIQATSTP